MAKRRRKEGPEKDEAPPKPRSEAALFARDIVTAVVAVAILMGAIFAYTQNWPPIVVVESSSMQHSDAESAIGVIDTGDLVLVQRAPTKADVTTFVEGRNTGYETYGDYGDVIIFRVVDQGRRGGFLGADPIIHRAIMFLAWNATGGGYDIPGLGGAGNAGKWGCTSGCDATAGPFALRGVIWVSGLGPSHDQTRTFNLDEFAEQGRRWNPAGPEPYSGFVTMGDNNVRRGSNAEGYLTPEQAVVGRARGEIPWFGLIKLTIFKTDNCCKRWGCAYPELDCRFPTRNSWDNLVSSLIVLISLPVFLDIGSAYWAKRKTEKARAKAGEVPPPPPEEPPPPPPE